MVLCGCVGRVLCMSVCVRESRLTFVYSLTCWLPFVAEIFPTYFIYCLSGCIQVCVCMCASRNCLLLLQVFVFKIIPIYVACSFCICIRVLSYIFSA